MKSLLEVLLSKVFSRQVLNVAAIKHKQTHLFGHEKNTSRVFFFSFKTLKRTFILNLIKQLQPFPLTGWKIRIKK